MSTQIQHRRGTTANHSSFTGVAGEATVDTTKKTLVVHDGATSGGIPLLREDLANVTAATGRTALGLGTVATQAYEEGTWTPTFAGLSTAGTYTYTNQSGNYTKVGRMVVATCNLSVSAASGAAGDMLVKGLPFTGGNFRQGVAVGYFGNIDLASGYTFIGGYVNNSEAQIRLFRSGDGVAQSAIGAAEFTSSSLIQATFVYLTA